MKKKINANELCAILEKHFGVASCYIEGVSLMVKSNFEFVEIGAGRMLDVSIQMSE